MSNPFYSVSGNPIANSRGISLQMRAEFVLLQNAFDKMPTLSGNAGKFTKINPSANGIDTSSVLTETAGVIETTGVLRTFQLTTSPAAGGVGYAIVDRGDASNSGRVSFVSAGAARQGYIGRSTTTAGTDAGTIPYVASLHDFTGAANVSGIVTAPQLRTFGAGVGFATLRQGTAGLSGYLEFYSAASGRQGYIGSTNTVAGPDAGTIPYVAGSHAFTGSITSNATITGAALASTGNATAKVAVTATDTGLGSAAMNVGDGTHTGTFQIYSPAGNRQGYIGFSTSNAATDTGTVNYVAGTHAFTGLLTINAAATSGLKFGNVDNTDPAVADYYLEDATLPTLAIAGSSAGIAYVSREASYQRFGNRVHFNLSIVLSNKGAGSGAVTVEGLAFNYAGTASVVCSVAVATASGLTGAPLGLLGLGSPNSISLQQTSATGSSSINDSNLTNSTSFRISGSYRVV